MAQQPPAATAPAADDNDADATSAAIAIVGAGPRGTSVLERLCASAPELLASGARLTVHVVDPAPPGPGRVWRTEQPGELLMNTVAAQVTLFTDDSVQAEGPVRAGPSLHEWYAHRAPGALGPDDYPQRALYGAYLAWVFAEVLRTAPGTVKVEVHTAHAVRLADVGPQPGQQPPGRPTAGQRPAPPLQLLELSDGSTLSGLAAVVLAQGHLPASPSTEARRLASYARAHGLHYLAPGNPADLTAELAALAPGETVLLRGLGLNFFDHVALLTSGRGGHFEPVDGGAGTQGNGGGLRYVPSGREPRLYAGSRRGIPYRARGDNEKGAHGRHTPLLLTDEMIAGFRQRADAGDPPDFRTDVWPLIAKEAETVYYATLLAARGAPPAAASAFRTRFAAAPHGGAREAAVLAESGIGPGERWDWDAVAHPYAQREFGSGEDFRAWLLGSLDEDIAHAALGNVRGPVKAALDVLRDVRNELRRIVDHGGLRGDSRRDLFDRWYSPLNAFLSIGPPRRRVEELVALIEADVVHLVGPATGIRMCAAGHGFVAGSPAVPGSQVTATALIEARLPEPDLRRTEDPLLRGLLADGGCRPHRVGDHETGGLDVTRLPYRLIDVQGRAHERRFAVGVPTEGVHWVTAAGARPCVNSVTLTDTDALARAALRSAAATSAAPPASEGHPVTGNGTSTSTQGPFRSLTNRMDTTRKVELASVDR